MVYNGDMSTKSDIGKLLKNKRLQLDLRMEQVVKDLGVTRTTLWSIENGNGNYTIDTLLKLMDYYKMSIDIDPQQEGDKKRASKVTKTTRDTINRFVIMCIEQFAAATGKTSSEIYNRLYEAKVLNLLRDDYEKICNFPSKSLNELINSKIFIGKINDVKDKESLLFTKANLLTKTISLIAKKYGQSFEDARNRIYESNVIELLNDETIIEQTSPSDLLLIYDKYYASDVIEIVGDNYCGSYQRTRYACRGVVIDDGKMLVSYASKIDLLMIPGGGRNDGEKNADCVVRELNEETGYKVTPKKQTIKIIEYYEDIRYVSYYFVCDIAGEGKVKLTATEQKQGLEKQWITFIDALSAFSEYDKYKKKQEEKCGAYLREYTALLKMLANKDISLT